MLREYDEIKEERKNSKIVVEYTIQKQQKRTVSVVKKFTGNKNSGIRRTKQNRLVLLSNCAVYGKKKLRSIKNQEGSRLELH